MTEEEIFEQLVKIFAWQPKIAARVFIELLRRCGTRIHKIDHAGVVLDAPDATAAEVAEMVTGLGFLNAKVLDGSFAESIKK